MTDLELVFTMLGEASTTEIAVQNDAQGFHQNKKDSAIDGNLKEKIKAELLIEFQTESILAK